MHKRSLLVVAALALLVVAVLGLRWSGGEPDRSREASLTGVLDGIDALARQFPLPGDGPLEWPRDHGVKPAEFAESWLFAGRLRDEHGESHGFQLAFYRVAVQAEAPDRDSAWATRDIYRARLSIEPAGRDVRSVLRASRAALGLAGARVAPATTWLEDWSFTADDSAGSFLLRARVGSQALTLRLEMPATLPTRIDAEVYRGYWWPGLHAAGNLVIDGQSHTVSGEAMLDRIWGRALPIGRGQLALARLWFDLGDGTSVRCAHLRRRAGGGMPVTECISSPASEANSVVLEVGEGGWKSVDGARLPLGWTVHVPPGAEPLQFAPLAAPGSASADGAWSGVLAGDDGRWGLLELSNFVGS